VQLERQGDPGFDNDGPLITALRKYGESLILSVRYFTYNV